MTEENRLPASGDLDALLDEALDAFDVVNKAPIQSDRNEPNITDHSVIPEVLEERPADPSSSAAPKSGLVFDPLAAAPKRRPSAPPAAPSAAQIDASLNDDLGKTLGPDELKDLTAGLSQLLAELANADTQTAVEDVGPASATSSARGDQQDLGATLRALAEQFPQGSSLQEEDKNADLSSLLGDDFLRSLAAQLQGGGGEMPSGLGGGGIGPQQGGLPSGLPHIVDTIMHQLLSKDVLYQPMKDIGARYPTWIEENRSKLGADEIKKYEEQYDYIQRITALYDSNPNDYATLMDLLEQMQQRGQPPQEIIDELAPGLAFGPDGLPTGVSGGIGDAPSQLLSDCKMQ